MLEVLSLYIPGVVDADELEKIALSLKNSDPTIPFTILAFFPEYRMNHFRAPTAKQMVEAYQRAKATGLQNIRLGNIGVFVHSEQDQDYLKANVDRHDF
jgi:pyruvate-formate lyase-activating enzyme